MSKRKAVAQALTAGLFMSLISVGMGLVPSAAAQGRCEPYTPGKVGSSVRVSIPNLCSVNTSRGQLQRYRGWLVGWRVESSKDIPAGKTVSIYWSCAGIGTYSYRGLNTVGNTYLFIGNEARFSC